MNTESADISQGTERECVKREGGAWGWTLGERLGEGKRESEEGKTGRGRVRERYSGGGYKERGKER